LLALGASTTYDVGVRKALALAAVAMTAPAAVAVAAQTQTYPVVAHLAGVPIKAPSKSQSWGACPAGALRLDRAEMRNAKRVVLAALPTLAKRATPHLRLNDARVILVTHTRRNGSILPTRRACWGQPFRRSALVELFLPAERSAALDGNPWFYVARTRESWVIWDEPH
jgi:hypothetical protein